MIVNEELDRVSHVGPLSTAHAAPLSRDDAPLSVSHAACFVTKR